MTSKPSGEGQPLQLLLRIDLRPPLARLQGTLARVQGFVDFGLRSADLVREGGGVLPGSGPRISYGRRASSDDVEADYRRWLVLSGLRDCTEALEPFLTEVWYVRKALDRLVPGSELSGEDLRGVRNGLAAERQKFEEHKTLGQKLRTLRDSCFELLPADLADLIDSFNRARVCLAHRQGRVAEKDCNRGGVLVLAWQAIELYVRTRNGEELALPEISASGPEFVDVGGGTLCMRRPQRERVFKVGDVLSFDGPEFFSGLTWTLWWLAVLIVANLEARIGCAPAHFAGGVPPPVPRGG